MTKKGLEDFKKEFNNIKSIEGTMEMLKRYKDTEYFPILKALLRAELNKITEEAKK